MAVTFTKLTDTFAAEISGIDIATGVNDEDITQIVTLFNEHSVPQAVVPTNPANGRKNFYTGAHASYIRGLPLEEGRALLKQLTAFSVQAPYTYTHQWQTPVRIP